MSMHSSEILAPLAWLRRTPSTIAQRPRKPERRSLVLHWRVLTILSARLGAGSEADSKNRRLLEKEVMVFTADCRKLADCCREHKNHSQHVRDFNRDRGLPV